MSRQQATFSDAELVKRKKLMSQMQFLGQMSSTETALFHQAAAARFGLGITDMKTISTLQQEGSKTISEIAKTLNLTTGAVTNVIDRLEKRELVKRTADKNDRRKVIIVLETKKLGEIDKIYKSMGVAFEKVLQTCTTKELEFLVAFYSTSAEMTKSEISKLAS